jgi:transposase
MRSYTTDLTDEQWALIEPLSGEEKQETSAISSP